MCWFHHSKYYKPHSIDLSSPFTTMSKYQVKTLKDKSCIKRQAIIQVTSLKPMELLPLLSDVNKGFLSWLKFVVSSILNDRKVS